MSDKEHELILGLPRSRAIAGDGWHGIRSDGIAAVLDRIDAEIRSCTDRLQEHESGAFSTMEQNLFVDADFSRVVRSNHDRVVRAFDALALQSEKARFRMTRDAV